MEQPKKYREGEAWIRALIVIGVTSTVLAAILYALENS